MRRRKGCPHTQLCFPSLPSTPLPPRKLLVWLFYKETNTKRVSAWRVPTLLHITKRLSTARAWRSHICSGEAAQWERAAGLEVPDDRRVEPRRSLSSPATCKRKEAARGEQWGCS